MLIKNSNLYSWIFASSTGSSLRLTDTDLVVSTQLVKKTIPYDQITDFPVISTEMFFWNKISINTTSGKIVAKGFSRSTAIHQFLVAIVKEIKTAAKRNRTKTFSLVTAALKEIETLTSDRWFRHSELERWRSEHSNLSSLNPMIYRDCEPKETELLNSLSAWIQNPHALRKTKNQQFLQETLRKHKQYFDSVESKPLTIRQREACVINEDNNLVLACAGSGKTSVIIAKAGFIVRMGWAKPHEILILAFAKEASKETQERLAHRIGEKTEIKASTFHSLGLQIIGEATGEKPSLHKSSGSDAAGTKFIHSLMTQFSSKRPNYLQDLVDYFSNYLYPIREQEEFKSYRDYLSHMKEVEPRSLAGELVKSHQELRIANFLFCNRIEYRYEENYPIKTVTSQRRQYKPDFFLPEYDIYIEHFGVGINNELPEHYSPSEKEEYLRGMAWKKKIHLENNTTLVETFSYQFKGNKIFSFLEAKLKSLEVVFDPISNKQLLKVLQKQDQIPKIAMLMFTFLNLQKNRNVANITQHAAKVIDAIQAEDILKFSLYNTERLAAFLRIYEPVYRAYETEVHANGEIDFNDMINHATSLVSEGRFRPPWKFILVDEFQDISESRANLVRELIKSHGNASLTCVGDDWQSIYRFTGSDQTYVTAFTEKFGASERIDLDLTFRSNSQISTVASEFIQKNSIQIRKDITSVHTETGPKISLYLCSGEEFDEVVVHILKRIPKINSTDHRPKVFILGRFRHLKPEKFNALRAEFSCFDILFDTVHSAKGKEADYVVVLNVSCGKYGFPSEMTNDPILDIVLPPSDGFPYSEERRLFYVAVTRAKNQVFIISPEKKPSSFVKELMEEAHNGCEVLNADGTPAESCKLSFCPTCETGTMQLRVAKNGRSFYGCSNFPLCDQILELCPSCSRAPLTPRENWFICPRCGHHEPRCPRCGSGRIKERTGPYGTFWSCSNWRSEDEFSCKYKTNHRPPPPKYTSGQCNR